METEAARALRRARASGEPDFIRTPTRVESTGLVIPPIRYDMRTSLWRLEQAWSCITRDWSLTIDAGWETDLASVPPPLRRYINRFQFGVTGPLLHDFLYEHGGVPPKGACDPPRTFERAEVDRAFLQLMHEERVPAWRRQLGYAVVRLAGRTHWEARARQRRPRPA